ncbi:MAG: glycosyltransferase family 4 protein [Syntrophobacteraceae bacterium]
MEFRLSNYIREICRLKPDAVMLHLRFKDRIVLPLVHWLKWKRIPIIFWTKGLNLDNPYDKLSYLAYRYMDYICDRIVLYSPNELKYISRKNRQKVFVANNTINHHDFPTIVESKQSIKNELGVPFDKVVLAVGSMGVGNDRKKIQDLVEVFNDINVRGAGLVIVGSGISEKVKRNINSRNTMYLGEVYDAKHLQISRIFKMADLFCLPGHVGLGLNQAFYWGLPVITEEGLHPPEIHLLESGRNGYIVPENDLSALKDRICYLLENDTLRMQFSSNARQDFMIKASIAQMFEGFMNCLDSLSIIGRD